ncbi:HET-domain-containing protein [Xylaria telfairii]|nr:HET-domain-containing protein [Xylaria telfairii]
MRLLNTTTFTLETFIGIITPPYAILLHTWDKDEVLFEDRWRRKSGAAKVLDSAKKAAKDGFKYIWIDTCCIDKSSSSELSGAINSMYQWYKKSAICYAYLSDMCALNEVAEEKVTLKQSRWFRRGWTELVAPEEVEFFNATWDSIGTRGSLAKAISSNIRIDTSQLEAGPNRPELGSFSVYTKMTSAYQRETTRPEDRAYSLMGLFEVNMPLLYGEGSSKAFERLQGEIIKESND